MFSLHSGFTSAVLAAALSAYLLSACTAPQANRLQPTATPAPTFSPSPQPTSVPIRTSLPTAAPSSTPTPAPTASPEPETVCSPLKGEPLEALSSPGLLKNPFAAPRPGYDDGHPGIDLAFWSRANGKPMQGLPVHSILSGIVAMTIDNRQPYGNAVVIETSLTPTSHSWLKRLISTTPTQLPQPSFSLSCPDYSDFKFDSQETSLYVLYAHLNQTPTIDVGDTVVCAQPIGEVGTTGRSVNPHLHLEIRLGPAGMRFASMAHYDPGASQDELRSYCLWRVSGAFPPLDPTPFIFQASQAQ